MMFDSIVESVLNEISAEDAYNKFYTDIPKEVFDMLLTLYGGKFDAIMKFVLNNIKELGNSALSRRYATIFLKKYKSAENNVRMAFLKRFTNGEFEDLIDAIQGLDVIEKEGVSTVSTIQKDGYVELYNDENFLLTCTLTYEASQHYYGYTKWCTASDRLGKYDGWYYFLCYVFGLDYIRSDEVYKNLGGEKYPVENVLIQFKNKEQDKLYQAQVSKNNEYWQVCDSDDMSIISSDFINNILPKSLNELIKEKLPELINIEKKCFETEYKFQTAKNDYIENKRELIAQRNRIKRLEMQKVLEEEDEKKCEFVQKKIDSIKDSNLFSNVDFIKQLITNSFDMGKEFGESEMTTKEIAENYEKILKSQSYLFVSDVNKVYDGVYEIYISPAFGHVHEIRTKNNNTLFYADNFQLHPFTMKSKINGYFDVFVKVKTNDENNDYNYLFHSATKDFRPNGEEFFKDFIIENVLFIEKSESKFITNNIDKYVNYPFKENDAKRQISDGITFTRTTLETGDYKYIFFNFNNNSRLDLVTVNCINDFYSIGDYILARTDAHIGYIFYTINVLTLKLEKIFRGNYVRNSDLCFLLCDTKNGDLIISTNKFYNTGLKVENPEKYKSMSVMYSDRYIVFNNDSSSNFMEDCKVFDIQLGKVIVMNGELRTVDSNNHYKNKYKIFDKDQNKLLNIDLTTVY